MPDPSQPLSDPGRHHASTRTARFNRGLPQAGPRGLLRSAP